MAILSCYPGLKANVSVGGELAREYDAPLDEVEARLRTLEFHKLHSRVAGGTPYSLSYIEAKPGEPFEFVIDTRRIKLQRGEEPQRIMVTAVLDGFKVQPKLVDSQVYTFRRCLTGSPNTGFSQTKFKFAALNLLEGPVPAKDMKKQIEEASNYGTLLIKLDLVHTIPGSLHPISYDLATPKPPVLEVAEKVLKGKAVDSRTTFESVPTSPIPVISIAHLDRKQRPFAIFEFRYRTMEGLIREFIVPRPEEVINVEEEYMRIKFIKPEIVESRGLKRESMQEALFSARYKQRRLEGGAVEIDLTDD